MRSAEFGLRNGDQEKESRGKAHGRRHRQRITDHVSRTTNRELRKSSMAKRTHLWKRSCQAVGARKVQEKSPHIPVAVGVGFPARRDAPSQPVGRLDDDVPSPAHSLSPRRRAIRRSTPPPGHNEPGPTERKTLNHLFGIAQQCGRRHEIQFEQRHHSNSRRSRMGTARLCTPSGFVSGSLPESFRPPLQLDTPVSDVAAVRFGVLSETPAHTNSLPHSGTAARS